MTGRHVPESLRHKAFGRIGVVAEAVRIEHLGPAPDVRALVGAVQVEPHPGARSDGLVAPLALLQRRAADGREQRAAAPASDVVDELRDDAVGAFDVAQEVRRVTIAAKAMKRMNTVGRPISRP